MAVTKIPVDSGNPYRDENGEFASPGQSDDSTTSKLDSSAPDTKLIDDSDDEDFDFDAFDDSDDEEESEDEEAADIDEFIKSKNTDFWHTMFPRSVDEVFDNIEKFVENKDVIGVLERNNHEAFFPGSYGNNSSYGANSVIINAIAKGQYKPMKLLPPQEFDKLVKERVTKSGYLGNVDWENQPTSRLGFLQRGVNHIDRISGVYLRNEGDLILTNGAYDSAVYTAYNDWTASGYGSKILSMLVDNKQAKIITSNEYSDLKRNSGFNSKMNDSSFCDNLRDRIEKALVAQGQSQVNANKDARHFIRALQNDNNFLAVCMGYDCIYDEGPKYCLVLNFGNIFLRDDKNFGGGGR